MGLLYKACNDVFDDVAQQCRTLDPNETVDAPWLGKRGSLNHHGRLGCILGQDAGIGLARRKRMDGSYKYKFYLSRRFAGWWGFEAWSLWKMALFTTLFTYVAFNDNFIGFWNFLFHRYDAIAYIWIAVLALFARGTLVYRYKQAAFIGQTKHWHQAAVCMGFFSLFTAIAFIPVTMESYPGRWYNSWDITQSLYFVWEGIKYVFGVYHFYEPRCDYMDCGISLYSKIKVVVTLFSIAYAIVLVVAYLAWRGFFRVMSAHWDWSLVTTKYCDQQTGISRDRKDRIVWGLVAGPKGDGGVDVQLTSAPQFGPGVFIGCIFFLILFLYFLDIFFRWEIIWKPI